MVCLLQIIIYSEFYSFQPDIVITPDTMKQRKKSSSEEEMSEKVDNQGTEKNVTSDHTIDSNFDTVQTSETERSEPQKSHVKL